MSAIHVFEYILGLGVFGFLYWILDGVQAEIRPVSQRGDILNLIDYAWVGIILIYLIFGGIWLIRKYNEKDPGRLI